MTPEDIERMAREAGLCCDSGHWFSPAGDPEDEIDVSAEDLALFAALVRAQALEDAAKCALDQWMLDGQISAKNCAAAIRALGDTK